MVNSWYHYCSLDAFLQIVQSKEIWLTNIFCMNDSAEHYWLRGIAKDILDRRGDGPKWVNDVASSLFPEEDETEVYCFCMSELPDSLGQWRGYADDGRGVAIGFSRDSLLAAEQEYRRSGLRVEHVVYDRARQEEMVERILQGASRDKDAPRADSLLSAEMIEDLPRLMAKSHIWFEAARCKNPFFEEEKEVRLIFNASLDSGGALGQRKYRTRRGTLIPYHILPLSPLPTKGSGPPIYEIVLGPKCNREFNERMATKLLSDSGYNTQCLHVWRSKGTIR
jgi:hypothetical protein